MSQVIKALFKIIANKEVQTSGNLDNQFRAMAPKMVLELSDGHVSKNGVHTWEAFELGLALGRDVREKTVYRVDIENEHYFFVGTEADILRKIEEEGGGDEDGLPEETIDMLEQEITK